METYTIKTLRSFDSNKDGEKYTTKNGKPYWRVLMEVEEMEGKTISALDFSGDIKEKNPGDTIEMEVETVEKNGKTYYNGKFPSKQEKSEAKLTELEDKVNKLAKGYSALKKRIEKLETGKDEEENTLTESLK